MSRVSAHRVLLPLGLALAASLAPAAPALASFSRGALAAPEDGARTPLVTHGRLDPARGEVGRWRREFDRRRRLVATTRGRGVQGIAGLLGVMNDLHGEVSDAELRSWLDEVAAERRRDPLLRAHASYLSARILEASGDLRAARQAYRDLGWLVEWQVVGPFDNTGRGGHGTAYGPETSGDEDLSFEGKIDGEPLSWHALPAEASTRALVSLDEYVRPNEQATAYARTWIDVPPGASRGRELQAALHLASAGPYKVWLDGELVAESDLYRTVHPLQDVVPVAMGPGRHELRVKISVDDGPWIFGARLATPAGAPIAGLEHGQAPPESTPSTGDGRPGTHAVRSIRSVLEASAKRSKPAAEDLVALAELYRWARPFAPEDPSDRQLARRADAAAQSPRSAYLLALLDPDPNGSRAALDAGIERARRSLTTDPGDAETRALLGQMLGELSWRYRSLGLEREARATLEAAAREVPDDALIELSRVDQLSGDGFPLAALAWVEDILARYPSSAIVRREHAGHLLALGRSREGLEALEALSEELGGDATLVAARIEALLGLGEVEQAASLARRFARSAPGMARRHAELARLELAQGDVDAALAAMRDAIALAPLDPDLHGAMGELSTIAGQVEGAIAAYRRSLQIKPQQPELRDRLEALDPRRRDDLFARHAVEFDQVVGSALPESWTGKEAALWQQLVAVRVLPNGLGERLDQRVIQVLDDRGVRSQAVQTMSYDPAESYVEVRRARVRRADGTVEEIGQTRTVSLAAAGYRMFYDQRQVQVHFPGLRVGDVIDVAFLRRDVAARNMFDDYFGDIVPLEGYEPRARVDYVLEAPAGRKLFYNGEIAGKADTRLSDADEGGKTRIYRWQRRDVPGIKPEAGMPGWSEVARYLHISTYDTWDQVARWYWGLVADQLVIDDAIRAGVTETMAALPASATELDKIAAIYRHVIRSTRYIGLEFGIHGYKPYRTTEVYERRFGDCKDKASLLKVMLAEIGVTAHLVLVRTRDQGTIGERPASLSSFNHAIVYVPEHDLFLDGTAEWSGPFELPEGDQGASVLVVRDGEGGTFRTIPVAPPERNLREAALEVRLDRKGDASVHQRIEARGAGAAGERARYDAPDGRIERLTQALGRRFPGTRVRRADFPDIGEVLAPVRIDADLDVPGWARPTASGGLRFVLTGQETRYVASLAPQSRRSQPLVLEHTRLDRQDIEYQLPAGLTFAHLPEPVTLESKFGRFLLEVEAEGRRARVRTELVLAAPRISPEGYAEFRDFLGQVDRAMGQSFEAVPQ